MFFDFFGVEKQLEHRSPAVGAILLAFPISRSISALWYFKGDSHNVSSIVSSNTFISSPKSFRVVEFMPSNFLRFSDNKLSSSKKRLSTLLLFPTEFFQLC
eukprot:NODE_63_length_25098_cov_0.440498.p22 type:complete len:101 gc:universal NODE_63_length_25098_cov_0.440498:19189-19491(+)